MGDWTPPPLAESVGCARQDAGRTVGGKTIGWPNSHTRREQAMKSCKIPMMKRNVDRRVKGKRK